MERAEYIFSLVGTILSCIAGILTIGIKLIKALKEVKERINKEKITEKLLELIEEAEKIAGYSGKEKKEREFNFRSGKRKDETEKEKMKI